MCGRSSRCMMHMMVVEAAGCRRSQMMPIHHNFLVDEHNTLGKPLIFCLGINLKLRRRLQRLPIDNEMLSDAVGCETRLPWSTLGGHNSSNPQKPLLLGLCENYKNLGLCSYLVIFDATHNRNVGQPYKHWDTAALLDTRWRIL